MRQKNKQKIKARKALCVARYATGRVSINKIAKIFDMCWSLVYRWINETAEKLPEYKIKDDVKEIEFDEMLHFLYKKRKLWVIKAFDKFKNKMIAWVTGSRACSHDKKYIIENMKITKENALKKLGTQAIGKTKGGYNTNLHMTCTDENSPVIFSLSPGNFGYASLLYLLNPTEKIPGLMIIIFIN